MNQVIKDIWAALKYVISPPPVDAKRYAQEPVSFWHKPTPVANVPKRSKAVEVDFSEDKWVLKDIQEMTDEYFNLHVRWKVPCRTRAEFIEYLKGKESRKSNAKEIEL